MELLDVINRRRTIRDFSEKEVPFEIIQRALNAGLKAPSYNHQKEWDFILVKDQSVRLALTQAEKMVEVVSNKFKKALGSYEALAQEMYLDAIPKQKKMILTAPEVLVVVYKPKKQITESKKVSDLNCLAAVWCCIENILLSLAENDVFGTTIIPKYTSEVKNVLNIPHELEVAVMIAFGYKALNAKIIPQKEVELESILHTNKW